MVGKQLKHLVFAALPTFLFVGTGEIFARLELRLIRGYSYAEALAYVPDPDLVYRHNPFYRAWKHKPNSSYDFFFIPPPRDDGPSPRILVLGGSTSEARPDGMDWPTVMEAATGATVINLGHSGYGTSQLHILYERYAVKVRPDVVVVFSGWNRRGSATSRFGWRPPNASSPFDRWPQRTSAFLINYSALYGRFWNLITDRFLSPECVTGEEPTEEAAMWVREYKELSREILRDQPLYIVLFPSLAMRSDAKTKLPPSLTCLADKFDATHENYLETIQTIQAIGEEVGATFLDIRPDYLELPIGVHVSYFRDQIHQTAEGNRFLAEAIGRELENAVPTMH